MDKDEKEELKILILDIFRKNPLCEMTVAMLEKSSFHEPQWFSLRKGKRSLKKIV